MLEPSRQRAPRGILRREFLKAMFVSSGLVPGFRSLQSALLAGNVDLLSFVRADSSPGLITSNSDFFVRNHFRTPQISSDSWNLVIDGLVSSPVKLSYSDLLMANSVRRTATLECAGNTSGGIGVGNAVWTGIPLSELLKQAEAKAAATTVILHGADSGSGEGVPANTHFARAVPFERAMNASTLLAYEMNGSPLPADHGFPLRALVAGWYGMDSVKWITRIELTNQPFEGYFQQQHYVALKDGEHRPITRMLVNSKFLRPSDGEEIGRKIYRVNGVAWSGERKIAKVEIRVSPGNSWQAASLDAPSVPLTWTSWTYDWQIPSAGKYTLEVRAFDDEGKTQPDVRDPDRQDAYELNTPHRIKVSVRL